MKFKLPSAKREEKPQLEAWRDKAPSAMRREFTMLYREKLGANFNPKRWRKYWKEYLNYVKVMKQRAELHEKYLKLKAAAQAEAA